MAMLMVPAACIAMEASTLLAASPLLEMQIVSVRAARVRSRHGAAYLDACIALRGYAGTPAYSQNDCAAHTAAFKESPLP